jgi:hypothetical protein
MHLGDTETTRKLAAAQGLGMRKIVAKQLVYFL